MKKYSLAATILMLFFTAESTAGCPTGYDSYRNWQDLPQVRLGAESGLASSYDRTGENNDWSYYESPPGQISTQTTCTIKTIQGPGVIYRFWMPHYMARHGYAVKMYFDDETTPRINTMSNTLFGGSFSYFHAPLIDTCAGGQVCYEPIPFNHSMVIETVNHFNAGFADRNYYQYSYLTYPPGTEINSYNGTVDSNLEQARNAVVSMFENTGTYPGAANPSAIEIDIPASAISGSLTLANLTGPGMVRKLFIKISGATDAAGLNLQVFYDGSSEAAIDVPTAYFFGAGSSRALYKSLPMGTDSSEGFYCYWPMPFKQSIVIRLLNTTGNQIAIDSAKIEYEYRQLNHHTCYLRAVEKSTNKSSQIYHNILSTTGCGHYVGDLLYVAQTYNSFNMLEGDDVIYSDGQLVQNGTGLEDTYNGGAYYNWVVSIADEPEGACPQHALRPLSGILYVNKSATSRADQYRWRIGDCIPFTRSIEVNVECRYAVNGANWRSVAFWYELPVMLEDINEDGIIDLKDFAKFSSRWHDGDCDDCSFADFTGDRNVDYLDLNILAGSWLAQR